MGMGPIKSSVLKPLRPKSVSAMHYQLLPERGFHCVNMNLLISFLIALEEEDDVWDVECFGSFILTNICVCKQQRGPPSNHC